MAGGVPALDVKVRPSAWAAFRLMTSPKVVGDSMGSSPDLALLHGEVVAFDIAEIPEALVEHLAHGGEAGARGEHRDASHRRLGDATAQGHEGGEGEEDEEPAGAALHGHLRRSRRCKGILRAMCRREN
jgi:hypothetical protein